MDDLSVSVNERLRKFLEERPLYSSLAFELSQFDNNLALELNTGFAGLSQIEMECPTCKQSRSFGRQKIGFGNDYSDDDYSSDEYSRVKITSNIYPFLFKCHSCSLSEYTFFIKVDIENGQVSKVGQNPSWLSTNVDKERKIYKLLENDADFFKKALICQSQGYGIAAFSYYRRVVENSIGKILNNIRSFLERENSPLKYIEEIDKALNATIMDDRIKIAQNAIPESLKENGINPLKTIYDTLSAGIHRLPEEECLKKCKDMQIALSYLIQKLPQQNEDKKTYIEALKHLNDKNKPS